MTVHTHLIRMAAVAAICAPFALSVAAHAIPGAMATPAATTRPPLRFGEYLVHLGRIAEGTKPQSVFRFKNGADGPLTIGDLSASCGCLKPSLNKQTYAPGEAGMFVVEADTAGEVSIDGDSLKQHYVDVPYSIGDEQHTARVHLKFVLPERHIVVQPRSLLVYQFKSEPTHQKFVVSDHRKSPMNITSVECPDPALAIETEISDAPGDAQRATISVTVPATLDHDISTRILIHTDDTEQPRIQIPIVVRVSKKSQPTGGGLPELEPPAANQ